MTGRGRGRGLSGHVGNALASDTVHVASDTVADKIWQAPLPGHLKGEHRCIRTIVDSAPLSWQKLRGFAAL